MRVVAAEPDSDPVVRRHGCEAGTVDHVFHGTGAASVRLDTGASWLFLREWLIALDA